MSVIGVAGVPMRWTLKRFMNVLYKAKVIKGRFEALNFDNPRAGLKTAYIRISETVDPLRVLQNFQNLKLTSNAVFKAFIADSVPDLPLADKLYQRGGGLKGTQPKMTSQQKKASKAQQKLSLFERRSGVGKPPEWILKATHKEILEEVLSKYTKLLELSKKTDHKLVDDIARTLFLRLKEIMDPDPDSWDTCFKLSKAYRKAHPHFADFQMILSHLHRLEDASGAPRSQLQECDVAVLGPDPTDIICKFPYEKMQKICNKYADRIVEKLSEHIKSLDESALDDSPEQAARKRVYQELKKTEPYLEAVVRHVVGSNLSTPDMPAMHRMRIYGEPFLPGKEVMYPILHKLGATTITRSILMYNMVRVNVPLHKFAALAALDGTERGGAKLVVRQSNYGAYNVKQALIDEMKVAFGRAQPETKKPDNQPDDQEDTVQDDDWCSDENLEMWM